tara:strand:- start:49 stop:840 length:792 start_codon:yes stop_codon:yes gene_type:complete
MDDPIHTNGFIKKIINSRKKDIVGLAVSKATRLKISKQKSKFHYVISLFLIMGLSSFVMNSFKLFWFKFKKFISNFIPFISSPSILNYASQNNIETYVTETVNDKPFLDYLKKMKPDVIINQTQDILKKDFLSISNIAVINRHNSLLPKNRGRITPFWVLYKSEKETGVSIHVVTEELDAGDIIVQKKFKIRSNDDFNTIVKKNYLLAPIAMLKALDILELGTRERIINDNNEASYNTTPTLEEALKFRDIRRVRDFFKVLIS